MTSAPSAGGRCRVVVLRSGPYDDRRGPGGELPYRIDELAGGGWEPEWDDRVFRSRSRGLLRAVEARTAPFAQALQTARRRRRADAVLAIFESEGHGLALARRILGRGRPPLVIVACWLADLVQDGGGRRVALYRQLYRAVDAVVVFSGNQRDVLERRLGIPPERVHVVRFGVDLDALAGVERRDGGRVVAVGRDLGRDWATLLAAAEGATWELDLVTRPAQLEGLAVPDNVTVHPKLPFDRYLALLGGASVVVVPTEVREYPTGQTVLLEAMALAKACVVTATPAMSEYVVDGVTALTVPPHDAAALRTAVDRLMADAALRASVGDAAGRAEAAAGGAAAMWRAIAGVLDEVAGAPR